MGGFPNAALGCVFAQAVGFIVTVLLFLKTAVNKVEPAPYVGLSRTKRGNDAQFPQRCKSVVRT